LAHKAELEEVKTPDNIMVGSKLTIDIENGVDFVRNEGKSIVKLTYGG
jgi:hypothetical protein